MPEGFSVTLFAQGLSLPRMMKVAPDGPTSLAGDAYDPQRKMSYRIHIRTGDKSMTTTGCVWGLLCKDMNWSRIEGAAE